MGYLNNQTITVDAILTTRGRELLAQGSNTFNITQFALADDEVDYRLWNPNHTLGSDYYDEVITNMPILEAVPDEFHTMKYKLITEDKNTTIVPILYVGYSSITLYENQSQIITPQIINIANANATSGYTATVKPINVVKLNIISPIVSATPVVNTSTYPYPYPAGYPYPSVPATKTVATTATYLSYKGYSFEIVAMPLPAGITSKTGTLTIAGNETGGQISINITVIKI